MDGKEKVINITLKRNQLDVVLDIQTSPAIEEFFRKASLEGENYDDDRNNMAEEGIAQTSEKWFDVNGNGLKYYVKNQKLSNKVSGYDIMDNFGNGLVEGDKINLAFLRCVGISKGVSIKTTDLLSLEEMKDFIQRLANWVKEFYNKHLVTTEVVASISVSPEDEKLAEVSA